MPSRFIFRAQGLPKNATVRDIEGLGTQFCKPGEKLALVADSVSFVPSCSGSRTQTALFSVQPPLPSFLKTEGSFAFQLRGHDVEVDMNFYGLTQMYPTPAGKPIIADIVAVTGINSHAYGSWKSKEGLEQMWLRDFLSKDFPNCRTMTFGYNADLKDQSVHRILDYCRRFLKDLEYIRQSQEEARRPIIFIGHSYGGLIVAHSLVKAKFDQTRGKKAPLDALLQATRGILFFGTPHRGMLVEDLVQALKKSGITEREGLLAEIQQNSKTLELQLGRFVDICDGFKIASFYELKPTRSLVVDKGDVWRLGGAYKMAVQDTSSILRLPNTVEWKRPVDADHSGMVKFKANSDKTYAEVRNVLKTMLSDAL
ncbi:hypothetical protein FN846DRAFT_907600 [Sphaerosporella brunnea]|uniref:Alpha/Beta hydrolase protein n=1 Tax=Sphaerosporella brunnea TaxID=1250544 RepID=A0A5J5EW00_9PEZI|nr:hypothetical protein FN846DRAFT_907600 [Sphaerosporella brunnea]